MFNEYSKTMLKEEIWRQEKENRLQKIRAEVEKNVDAEGTPIDFKIKETVIALMVLGMPTSTSCEGHVFEGDYSAPWIEI